VLSCGNLIWVGEREGSITVRRMEGDIIHIIERRKGAYVFCMVAVGNSVWAGCSDGFIRVLSQLTYKMERQFARHGGGGGAVNTLVYHAPSQSVFSGSNDFEILAWDANTGEFLRQFSGHSNAVRTLLADTHTLYSGSDDGTVLVWDLVSGNKAQQWTGHLKGVHSLCMTEHHVWSGSEDATIRIWNPATGECIGVAEVHTGSVDVMTSIGDKVWSGAGDTICVWDAVNLKLLGTYVAHDGYIGNVIVAAKSTQYKIWSTATDSVVKVWQTESTPDETSVMRRKLERLSMVDFENARMQEALAQRDVQIAELSRQLKAVQDELTLYLPLRDENQKLRDDVAARDAAIAQLNGQLRAEQQRSADLMNQIAGLERLVLELRAQNDRLGQELDAARGDIAALNDKIREIVQQYEARLQELTALIALIESQKSEMQTLLNGKDQEADQMREELRRAMGEVEGLSGKLRDMDIVFKSRLTLITEIFKLYKRFETADKKLRGVSTGSDYLRDVSAEISSVVTQFRNVIANHFTDDELNHLGTSRHFFPITFVPTDSQRVLSPTSQRSPGRK
jgi:predicted  nucleic acid-binding Zn-ribbon protein